MEGIPTNQNLSYGRGLVDLTVDFMASLTWLRTESKKSFHAKFIASALAQWRQIVSWQLMAVPLT